MKIGMRKPSLKKSFKARTTGKLKRRIKRAVNPFYGKKGMGFIRNPKRSIYNKVYRKATFSPFALGKGLGGLILGIIILPFWLVYAILKLPFALCKALVFHNRESIAGADTELVVEENTTKSPYITMPEFREDYAKAVFLWANSKPSPVKEDNEYPSYLRYECGIERPSAYHRELIEQGYYRPSTYQERLTQLKVTELKEILSNLSLPQSGKKDELIARVLENIDIATIDNYCKESFSLTELGIQFIEEHADYIEEHKTPTIQNNEPV